MITTVALLMVLEGFWLRSAMRDELMLLKRETNFIYRSTLLEMQDSLIRQNIRPVEGADSGTQAVTARKLMMDSFKIVHRRVVGKEGKLPPSSDNIQIFITSDGRMDSLKPVFFRPLVNNFSEPGKGKAFVIRMKGDSLKRSDIQSRYKKALSDAGIDLPFRIIHLAGKKMPPPEDFHFDIRTEWVPVMPANSYVATFDNVSLPILRKIAPQILFSVFLTALTVMSFLLLYQSMKAQQRLMTLKNDFISNVTHELKTPIATVSVALEALKEFKGMDENVSSEYIDMARQELGRLTLLTDKVLTSAILDEHGIKNNVETVRMNEVIAHVLNSMKLVTTKRKAKVSFETTGNDFTVQGSLIHLTSVIFNLLDNALKYSPGAPDVTILLKDNDDHLELSVSDKGIGISKEFHKKIFEKFFRMPTGDVHNVKGHGLGLSYADSVIKAHGGSIKVDSEPGRGSQFIIQLPKKS
ncbi:MAG: HAMP domain-containing histidine kinase [Bacteroidetes bacterium]|nr:HAMP domain-containing histidine kinase [Bacteroidota bacterium]